MRTLTDRDWTTFTLGFLRTGTVGAFAIEKYTIDAQPNRHDLAGRATGYGQFTRLVERDDTTGQPIIWMSDTRAEILEHYPLLTRVRAGDRVLVSGLGLGLAVAGAVRLGASSVTVIETSSDVIELVGEQLTDWCSEHGARLQVIHGDARTWMPDTHYDLAWHDIWPTISESNHADMLAIKEHYRHAVLREQACWAEQECQMMATIMDKLRSNTPLTAHEYTWAVRSLLGTDGPSSQAAG